MEIWKRKIKSSGKIALYLDYSIGGQRTREALNMYLRPGRENKFENEQIMREAQAIRAKREHDIISGNHGFIPRYRKTEPILKWMAGFVDRYNKKDKRRFLAMLHSFQRFIGNDHITAGSITAKTCTYYKDHLHETHNGETPFNYWKAFKHVLKAATEAGFFRSNPADGIKNVNHRANELTKQTLFPSEIRKLKNTPCGNDEVKRAFLFSTQTGLRYCDIVQLQWKHVFIKLGYIDFSQSKTDRRNFVYMNSSAIKRLGKPGLAMDHVFQLPSANGTNKDIKNWVKRAKIQKHITYHCARHSFITNLIENKVDLMTASRLAGHSSTRPTERYTHISDERKKWAVNQLPGI